MEINCELFNEIVHQYSTSILRMAMTPDGSRCYLQRWWRMTPRCSAQLCSLVGFLHTTYLWLDRHTSYYYSPNDVYINSYWFFLNKTTNDKCSSWNKVISEVLCTVIKAAYGINIYGRHTHVCCIVDCRHCFSTVKGIVGYVCSIRPSIQGPWRVWGASLLVASLGVETRLHAIIKSQLSALIARSGCH